MTLGCDPQDRRPGLWVTGEVAPTPADWSFIEGSPEIFVETRTWYGIPHSVTTVCVAVGDHLYVPSVYGPGGVFPEERFWNRNVIRDPRVRLKIGERVYELEAALVEDPAEAQSALDAFVRVSPYWGQLVAGPEAERPTMFFLRMMPRSDRP